MKLQHEAIISNLVYTDDMALVVESWDDLKSMLDDVSIRRRDLGLTISCSKTKPLAVLPSDVYPKPAVINLFPDDGSVEVVSNFQYLGSIVQDNCGTAIEEDCVCVCVCVCACVHACVCVCVCAHVCVCELPVNVFSCNF